jgi:hypothetical protein
MPMHRKRYAMLKKRAKFKQKIFYSSFKKKLEKCFFPSQKNNQNSLVKHFFSKSQRTTEGCTPVEFL